MLGHDHGLIALGKFQEKPCNAYRRAGIFRRFKAGLFRRRLPFPGRYFRGKIERGHAFLQCRRCEDAVFRRVKKQTDKKFPSDIKLYFYDNGVIKPIITDIVGHWQNKLGAFINIETASSVDKLTPQLKSRDLPIAVFPIRADSKSLSEFSEKFGVSASGKTRPTPFNPSCCAAQALFRCCSKTQPLHTRTP